MTWTRQEAGWYTLGEPGPSSVAVCRERDGYWHTYVRRDGPPGDSRHRTMRAAMRAAERLWKERGR